MNNGCGFVYDYPNYSPTNKINISQTPPIQSNLEWDILNFNNDSYMILI